SLGNPDEARYAEIPREMVAQGQYLIPHIDGIPYFEKPDFFYWLQTISIHVFGLSAWSMRLANMALAIFGCLLVYIASRMVWDRITGLYASLILSTTTLYYASAHYVTLDMTVSVMITGTLLTFWLAICTPLDRKRRALIYLSALFSALAVLTKGFIGIVL